MKKLFSILFLIPILVTGTVTAQQITGLEGFSLFLDPGHSQSENEGLFNYSEAEKVLRVGLELRRLLLTYTDIDTVYISRTNDLQQVSLSQRTDLANFLGPDFFHSIHSNAGSASTNNTLFLHGGWRKDGQTLEKSPAGGKDMGDIMEVVHTAAMRIPTIGNYADRTFYQGFPTTHTNQWPFLHVNRETNMASVLSESGFHTNPGQQQKNLNTEWKDLEAMSFFWVMLEYLGVERPTIGISTGFITNADNDEPLNGATVTVGDSSYTTDTYESLFDQYSAIPDELKNGFYYITGLSVGQAELIALAEGFYPDTVEIEIDSTDFTFTDIALISSVPPFIKSNSVGEDNLINPGEELILNFSRSMDKQSVDEALSFTPQVDYTSSWNSLGTELTIITNNFEFVSNYTLRIDSSAFDNSVYAHSLDGNGNGVSNGDYVFNFDTGQEDINAPELLDIYPVNVKADGLMPIARVTFSEHLDTSKIDSLSLQVRIGSYSVPGTIKYYTVKEQSVLNFFPAERLEPNKFYKLQISGVLSDTAGNSLGSNVLRTFQTPNFEYVNETTVDNFDGGINSWWQPSQSGSTTGYLAEETGVSVTDQTVNLLTASTQAMQLNYGWDTTAAENLIREYRSVGLPRFGNQRFVQSYVFGDGSENKFRFMIRDASSQLEGSRWYSIDWMGWKLVTWDLAQDSVIGWVNGNGSISGNSYVDSYQLTHSEGGAVTGTLVFDDFRVVDRGIPTSTQETGSNLPTEVQLSQNYPNPFNPSTQINFALPRNSEVSLKIYDMLGREVATLYEGVKKQGFHSIRFDASAYASGIYIYRLITETGSVSKKMTLLK